MIIDNSYFTGKLEIPNLSNDDQYINNNATLDQTILEYEFQYLKAALGFKVAKDVINAVGANGQITGSQKYKDLIDGLNDWIGLRYEINGVKYSQIANYVYCQYLLENQTQLTESGNSLAQFEKGSVLSSWNKFNIAWQAMIKERQTYDCDYHYLYDNRGYITLHEYLSKSDDWDVSNFEVWRNTNKLGI